MGLRMRIGYVPDHFGLYDNLKVSEYMEFLRPAIIWRALKHENAPGSLLEQVGLGERMDVL